jgi:ABC-type transport system involved in multi-copper enzyme maturation permease subunit
MKHAMFIVAKNTYIEMLRDRVLYFVIIFSLLFMGLCFALGQLSYSEIFRLSVSLGLGGIHLCFMGLTIFLGSSVFYREIEHKTIYTLLVRPITRGQYLFGKYLGLVSILFTMLLGFMFFFTFIEMMLGVPLLLTTYQPYIGIFFESCILLAVTFFFSCFSKPFLTVTCSLSFFLIGHWIGNLNLLVAKSKSDTFKSVGTIIANIFPDLEMLNWRDFAIAQAQVPGLEMGYGVVEASLWSSLFFLFALIIFRNKDFE